NPIMVRVERRLFSFFESRKMKAKTAKKLSRALGVITAIAVGIAVVYAFFAMLLPNLVDSISGIVTNLPAYYQNAQTWVMNLSEHFPEYSDVITGFTDRIFETLEVWAQEKLLGNLEELVVLVTSQVYLVFKGLLNVLIGLVAAIYMLFSKEKFLAQTKKIIVALFKRERADRLLEVSSHSNRIFSGFISGKIVDSLIIGLLCYAGMRILKLPYPELISFIVGLTNVIPFFGPFIGAIPSIMLILLVDPMQALYFGIFVFVLQQLDGNVIGPYILGDAVGLPSFWILVSITVFGGLFGFVGMLLGVPVFAVIYMLVREFVEGKLRDKGAPVSTAHYYDMKCTHDLERSAEASEEPKTEEGISEEELQAAENEFWQ
ncbi:MAG: AI-2E family transporter, partial [Oscillospiraceae bacterium]|nr:AI-2E family transporter [Oscillospiraceae bacterium]